MSMAPLFDHIRSKQIMSVTNLRKIFTTIGMLVPATCMLSLNFLEGNDIIGFIILLTLCMSGHHFAGTGGYYLSHSDLALSLIHI